MAKKKRPSRSEPNKTRALPVKMPISFDDAVSGLLAVQPKKKNKPASKKLPKRANKEK